MMLQNSLDRLFEGMAASLHEVVVPALDDPFAKAQAVAVAELLGNLAARVEWRCADQLATIAHVREVLGDLSGETDEVRALLADPVPAAGEAAELAASTRRHLAALAAAQSALAPERLREVVLWHLDAELSRLRSASFGRSS